MNQIKYALELARIVLLKGPDIKKAVRDDAISAINVALCEPRQKYINDDSQVGDEKND